jgi:LPXTG-site transpeptidase (sortase) family protein
MEIYMNSHLALMKFRRILLALICLTVAVFVFEVTRPYRPDNFIDRFVDALIGRDWIESELPTVETAGEGDIVYVEVPADADLTGMLYISPERESYEEGEMTLIVPALDLNTTVSDGTTRQDLRRNPGLFEFSGMPGNEKRNVSIAGHRSGGVFFYLDKLAEGDWVYLIYDSRIFAYLYSDRTEVLPTDWSIIADQGFDCCTLITCTPVDLANKRMVVRFELEKIYRHSPEMMEYLGLEEDSRSL